MKTGKALWDINYIHQSWKAPYDEIAFVDEQQRILPDEYQCARLRLLEHALLVKDNFLPQKLLHSIHQATNLLIGVEGNWSTRFHKQIESSFFKKLRKKKRLSKLSSAEIEAIEHSLQDISNYFWTQFSQILISQPEEISHIHSWINTGPLSDGQIGKYHFTHYDCDEYLEFSKGLYRFPVYAAVLYIDIPENGDGGVTWFPEIKQGVIPKTNRLAVFDARLAHSVLPITPPNKKPRIVMVMNLWDYETRDEQYELSNGILGYTENRKGELEWLP